MLVNPDTPPQNTPAGTAGRAARGRQDAAARRPVSPNVWLSAKVTLMPPSNRRMALTGSAAERERAQADADHRARQPHRPQVRLRPVVAIGVATPKMSIAHRIGSMMPAASGGAMKIDISGTATPPAPPPKPPLAMPVSNLTATTATG